MPLTRISITIPAELVEWADERAEALDRSRSWLICAALRRYLREVGVHGERSAGGRGPEPAPAPADARAAAADIEVRPSGE